MPPNNLNVMSSDEKLKTIQALVKTFKMERIIYVILTCISAMTLLGVGMYLALAKDNFQALLTLLVPTGTLTMCIFRVLKMWDDAMSYLNGGKSNV